MILILLIWTMEVKPLAMMSPMFVDVIAHIVSGLFFKDNSSQFDVKILIQAAAETEVIFLNRFHEKIESTILTVPFPMH